eukprot:2941213-Alexandrium_andersonii.AAC.1
MDAGRLIPVTGCVEKLASPQGSCEDASQERARHTCSPAEGCSECKGIYLCQTCNAPSDLPQLSQ